MSTQLIVLLVGVGLLYYGRKKGNTVLLVIGAVIAIVGSSAYVPGLIPALHTLLTQIVTNVSNFFSNVRK